MNVNAPLAVYRAALRLPGPWKGDVDEYRAGNG
jgi:hypothetical protein